MRVLNRIIGLFYKNKKKEKILDNENFLNELEIKNNKIKILLTIKNIALLNKLLAYALNIKK